jgi:hypothetical protein
MATYQGAISTQGDIPKNATEQINLGTLAYKVKCKWENQARKAELRLVGEQE